mmetsp:Transcript_27657/g.68772  ORF Transcript_27657/g.68772 Transcript_27657/m.68772 type:complete len:280 (+) Transcript_27657:1428-2267(+)
MLPSGDTHGTLHGEGAIEERRLPLESTAIPWNTDESSSIGGADRSPFTRRMEAAHTKYTAAAVARTSPRCCWSIATRRRCTRTAGSHISAQRGSFSRTGADALRTVGSFATSNGRPAWSDVQRAAQATACCTEDPVRTLCPAERWRAAASMSERNAFIRSASTGSPKRANARRSQKRSHSRTNEVPARTELAPHVSRCRLRAAIRSVVGSALGEWRRSAVGTVSKNSFTARSMSSSSPASTSARRVALVVSAASDAALAVSGCDSAVTTSAVHSFTALV